MNVIEVVVSRGPGPAINPAADAVDNSEPAPAVPGIFDFTAGSPAGDDVAGCVIAVVINPCVAICCGCERQENITVISTEGIERNVTVNVVPSIRFSHFNHPL